MVVGVCRQDGVRRIAVLAIREHQVPEVRASGIRRGNCRCKRGSGAVMANELLRLALTAFDITVALSLAGVVAALAWLAIATLIDLGNTTWRRWGR